MITMLIMVTTPTMVTMAITWTATTVIIQKHQKQRDNLRTSHKSFNSTRTIRTTTKWVSAVSVASAKSPPNVSPTTGVPWPLTTYQKPNSAPDTTKTAKTPQNSLLWPATNSIPIKITPIWDWVN